MGQPVAVIEHQSRTPGVIRFEANRNLTGQGHERFTSAAQAVGTRPAATVARRLLETGKVASVHVYGNMITVDLLKGRDADGLGDIVTDLYTYYRPGVEVPSFEDLVAEPEAASVATPSSAEPEAALSEAAKKIPPHLLARSQAAKEKARAKAAGG